MPVYRAKVFKMEDVQMVRAEGSGVAGGHYGFADLVRIEKKEGVKKSSGNGGGVGKTPIA